MNPNFFSNSSSEEAYVLSVSLILLNQASHNKNIPSSLKMTKEQFTKQSIEVAPLYPVEQFWEMYDRIQKMQFKTDT